MSEEELKEAESRGFTQGVAWAIALQHRYDLGPDQMMHESGLGYQDFKRAGVVPSDLNAIRSKSAQAVRKEFEGAITEMSANKTLNPRDPYNEGFNAGIDEAIKFVQHYIKGEGLFQL